MKRPRGFRLLAVLFAWLALAGAMNTCAALRFPTQYERFGIRPWVLALVSLWYLATAAGVAIGLWRATRWVPRATVAWGSALLLLMAALQTMIGIAGEPLWLVALPHVMFGALTWALYWYVRQRVSGIERTV